MESFRQLADVLDQAKFYMVLGMLSHVATIAIAIRVLTWGKGPDEKSGPSIER